MYSPLIAYDQRPSQRPRARASVPPPQPCSDMALLRAPGWGAPCPAYIRGNSPPWRAPLELHLEDGAERSIDLRTAGLGGARRWRSHSDRTQTHNALEAPPLLLSLPPLPFFSIKLVSHLTKVVHNKAGDIQFLISDLTGDCGFLISILDP